MILVIDFGSQYNQLIARRVRENRVYCRIEPPDITAAEVAAMKPDGIILSGGPSSIYEDESPQMDTAVLEMGIPILGICYGMQFLALAMGGEVTRSEKREYGRADLIIREKGSLLKDVRDTRCWMSHGDSIETLPRGFSAIALTRNTKIAAAENPEKKIYGLQFHPEVAHTPDGVKIMRRFIFDVCGCEPSWTMKKFAADSIEKIREKVGDKKVILGLSGGVDSSVTASLVQAAIGSRLTCVFIDNGLLRENEALDLKKTFKKNIASKIRLVSAKRKFLSALSKVTDPEKKRKIIGRIFVDVFEAEAQKIKGVEFLAQGTIYPDVIESKSAHGGPSAVIKSHHNVGGLPERMKLKLIEPLNSLFKDEVRELGLELGLDEGLIWRHPFPGPGLAIRIMGAVTQKKLSLLRKVDAILLDEIEKNKYGRKLWQAFAVLLPIKTVGVMGDKRTYDHIAAIRAVTSKDAMTADWARLPHDLLAEISNRIINEVDGINRAVYDITSKPPGTIEWE
ncbi:GMP synthetase (glutamine aminotransferase) [Candidatus Desulfarcum epimagneticum]|uniref:GMP synthase [glutamine-hydrolyzing] n=1 Tax=uncultured Desulfobacteraceae bacterium TaxID=218296 RepID=A0A484HKG9_9BACT|nr:GMP synthetase (glutamine aminotransferase) [uncultured Desulfobacteraceae bacterium]